MSEEDRENYLTMLVDAQTVRLELMLVVVMLTVMLMLPM